MTETCDHCGAELPADDRGQRTADDVVCEACCCRALAGRDDAKEV